MKTAYLVYIVMKNDSRLVVAVCQTLKRAETIARRWQSEKHVLDAYTSSLPMDETI